MDVIGELIADVRASGHEPAKIAAGAGMAASRLSEILERQQLPTVHEYFAIRRAIHPESTVPDEVVADLERLRATLGQSEQTGDRSEQLEEILEDLLRAMDRGRE
jgi:CRISPR/Cas system CSM-associated protein Csm2 small subunit